MSEYAQKECAGCGRMQSASEMLGIQEEVAVGRSSGRWSAGGSSGRSSWSSSGHTSYGNSSSSSSRYTSGQTYYEKQKNWYCVACYEARQLAIAAGRKKALMVGGGIVLVLLVAVAALVFAGDAQSPGTSASEEVVAAAQSEPLQFVDTEPAEEPAEPLPLSEDAGPQFDASPTMPAVAPPGGGSVAEDSSQYRALLVSLETGEPARWSDGGGLEGSVSVSDATAYPDRRCRSFQYRTSYRGETNTSGAQMACQAPGEPWRVQP